MVLGKMVGMLFVFFIIMIGSLLAIQAYSATDNRTEVPTELQDTYNTTRSIAAVNINFMSVFAFILVGLLLILAVYWGTKIFT